MFNGLKIERPSRHDLGSAYIVFENAITLAFQQEDIIEEASEEIEYKKSLIRASVENPDSEMIFLVAKLEGRVIGTVSFGPCGDDIRVCTNNELNHVGELGSLYVLPEYQGQGVGSRLIETMLQHLQSNGVKHFCLDCGLKVAQEKWLRKFGEPYKMLKDYWGKGSHHLVWLCDVADYIN